MRLAALVVASFACFSTAASAADWWWIGLNGDPPARIVTYVDRETLKDVGKGRLQLWALAIGERALPNGQQHQATGYGIDCRKRSLATLKRVGLDSAGAALPLAEAPPSAYTPVVPGSIGETILNFACGRSSGMELRVPNAFQHAATYLFGVPQQQPKAAEQPKYSTGTGFFVGPNGELVTSHHVVEGAKRILVNLADGTRLPATVVRMSPATDLAVLKINTKTPGYLSLGRPNAAKAGDRFSRLASR